MDLSCNRNIIIDIDHTIFTGGTPDNEYLGVSVIPGAKEAIDALFAAGFKVYLHTARHFKYYDNTIQTLKQHGIRHSGLFVGKPLGFIYIDDRGLRFNGNWKETVQQVMGYAAQERTNDENNNPVS